MLLRMPPWQNIAESGAQETTTCDRLPPPVDVGQECAALKKAREMGLFELLGKLARIAERHDAAGPKEVAQ